MADLSDIQAAQPVKIIGSDSSGVESNPLQVTTLGIRIDPSFSSGSNTRPNITNTSSTILAANSNRKYAMIINSSGSTIYLKFEDAAVVSQGIPMSSGAVYEINMLNLWTGTVNAIKQGGGSVTIDVFEGSA